MIAFIRNRIRSLYYVFVGMWYLIRTESAIIVHAIITLLFTFLGFYVGITPTEWIVQLVGCGLVLTIESLNTAIEKICDFIHPNYHEKIGNIKDVSAGAVGFMVGAVTTALIIIYYPYFF